MFIRIHRNQCLANEILLIAEYYLILSIVKLSQEIFATTICNLV